jgi:hypothetical protein
VQPQKATHANIICLRDTERRLVMLSWKLPAVAGGVFALVSYATYNHMT